MTNDDLLLLQTSVFTGITTDEISITNNKLSGDPETFNVGAVSLPDRYLEEDSVNTMEEYFPRIYTVVPGLEITSLTSNSEGNFVFDGIIPQKVSVTAK